MTTVFDRACIEEFAQVVGVAGQQLIAGVGQRGDVGVDDIAATGGVE
ncbi:MAG: hypothetical protein ACRDTE_02330 [Pseudonocardiaceae bacterium]